MAKESTAAPKVHGSRLKAAARYLAKMERGERIMRDACGRLQWSSGKPLAPKTVEYLLDQGKIRPLDTDLFGDPARGQTLGLAT